MTKQNQSQNHVPAIEEQIAIYSLDRPDNPLLEAYLNNRANPEQITYLHPLLKKYIQNTYGVLVYHEQLIEILQDFAGFSSEEANEARRALGKRHTENIEHYFLKFKRGCIANTAFVDACQLEDKNPEDVINELWQFFFENAIHQFPYNFAKGNNR